MAPEECVVERRRPVRSFVLREGRFTEGQRSAYARCWPRFGLDDAGPLDPAVWFDDRRPLYLEIGFGNGEALAEIAARHPENHYLGIEVHRPGVGHLLLRLESLGLENVRVMRCDAMEVLRRLPAQCLDGVMLFFPDPWHKKRHHKRRIVQPEFARRVARCLKPGGVLHLATDWEDYAMQMMQVLSDAPAFENCLGEGQFAPRPQSRPLTRFEQRGQRLGHGVWDLLFKKN